MTRHDRIIDKIESVRVNNNVLWMNILRVAIREAPEETKALFKKVQENDLKVVEYSKELVADD